jgi:hypothetical protein
MVDIAGGVTPDIVIRSKSETMGPVIHKSITFAAGTSNLMFARMEMELRLFFAMPQHTQSYEFINNRSHRVLMVVSRPKDLWQIFHTCKGS